MPENAAETAASRPAAESALLTRLRLVLGKNLNQSDIDFLHVLVHPDVIDFTFEYIDYNYLLQSLDDLNA